MESLVFVMEKRINNERGVVLVVALLMMVALTIIGIAATSTTMLELQIAGNSKVSTMNFYTAESAALEGAQRLINETSEAVLLPAINNSSQSADLVRSAASTSTGLTADKDNLDYDGDGNIDINDLSPSLMTVANATVGEVVTLNGVKSGSSLGMDTSRVYDYTSYGVSQSNRGNIIIKVGVKKRF